MRRPCNLKNAERGFTLTEMLIATAIILVGLVAVGQLVPASAILNANNRNDGTALVLAQRQLEMMREIPLNAPPVFTDPLGQTDYLGDPTQPGQVIGSPVVPSSTPPLIDFSADPVGGYSFTYTDPNDPFGATNDLRWAVVTFTNQQTNVTTGRRIILGVFRRGMKTQAYPITLDTMVEK